MTVSPTTLSNVLGEKFWEDPASSSSMPAPPVVVRLAGLPAQALEPLTSPPCIALLQTRESLEKELAGTRRSMVEAIGNALPGFSAGTRRFLLAVKRNCFNGRELETFRRKSEWTELLRVSPSLAERVLILEEQLRENDCAFIALYEQELTRERRHVIDLIRDRRFVRGVALGRPGLVRKVRVQAPSLVSSGSLPKLAKWEQSLLRFVTRASAKLSANSTLTAYALGSIQASPSPMGFRFVGSPQREVSLVRINRPELEQLQALLMRHPVVREHALVAWNDSLEELGPGQYRFLRDGHWELAPGAEEFRLVRPARITVRLSHTLLGIARDSLQKGELRYSTLLALLEDRNGLSIRETPGLVTRIALDQLVDLGLLILMPPWPTHETWLERRIWQFLRTLADEPTLRAAADALEELLTLEKAFVSASRPERSVAGMENAFSRVLDKAGNEGPLSPRAHLFEDVLFEAAASSDENRGIFQIAPSTVQEIMQSVGLVSRFAGLFNHRHDVLHTLAGWWRDHGPSRREAPFTEIAQGFAPLWKQFLSFQKTENQSALSTFDPLHVAPLEALREKRKTLLARSQELLSTSPTKDLLPSQQFAELLEALPRQYVPLLGSCAFVQPADPEGNYWVLNRLGEGTGRYLSRVTPVLEESLQQCLLDHLTARSVVTLDDEETDLLEVKYPWGSLVNAYPPQAAKVLDIRGMYLDLPQERRLRLGDLTIRADLDAESFRLIAPSGRRVLPVHLSSAADAGLPPLLRLLLAFGLGETRSVFPFAFSEGDDFLTSYNRLTCGKLILRRRRWRIGIEGIRNALDGFTDLKSYVYIRNWCRQLDIPMVGFYYELTYQGTIKPQYVDFSSPSLCNLFVSSLRKMASGYLSLEEALPSPADFPFDASLNRRGFELLIDSLAIRTLSGNSSAKVSNPNRERGMPLGKEEQDA